MSRLDPVNVIGSQQENLTLERNGKCIFVTITVTCSPYTQFNAEQTKKDIKLFITHCSFSLLTALQQSREKSTGYYWRIIV